MESSRRVDAEGAERRRGSRKRRRDASEKSISGTLDVVMGQTAATSSSGVAGSSDCGGDGSTLEDEGTHGQQYLAESHHVQAALGGYVVVRVGSG